MVNSQALLLSNIHIKFRLSLSFSNIQYQCHFWLLKGQSGTTSVSIEDFLAEDNKAFGLYHVILYQMSILCLSQCVKNLTGTQYTSIFFVNLHYTNKELWYEGVKGNWRSSSVLQMPEITNRNHEKTITFTRRVEPEKNPSCLHVESQQMCCNLVQTETDCIYQFSNSF